jgi:hypothetical protein
MANDEHASYPQAIRKDVARNLKKIGTTPSEGEAVCDSTLKPFEEHWVH